MLKKIFSGIGCMVWIVIGYFVLLISYFMHLAEKIN
jgi:hypothetical protein